MTKFKKPNPNVSVILGDLRSTILLSPTRPPTQSIGSLALVGCSITLFGLVLAHVYLLNRGIATDQVLTFWLPLEIGAFLILMAALYSEEYWVFILILLFAATLHFVIPISQLPNYAVENDAIYGYQRVQQTIATGSWTFGSGTGSATLYSYFPLFFIFTALWSTIGSIPPFLLTNYGFAAVNLTSLLTLRMLVTDLLHFTKRQTNLVLFFYSLNPIIHRVEAGFHYEAYAVIFFSLVFLYMLKPKISLSENVVAIVSILAISLSHYFTSYILILNVIVLSLAYAFLRGTKVQTGLLFLALVAPLAWDADVSLENWSYTILRVENILSHVKSLSDLLSRLTAPPGGTFYASPLFGHLATVRNLIIVGLGLLAILTYCFARGGSLGIRIKRNDVLPYLAASWLFSLLFSVAAYYGVAWSETVLAPQGPNIAPTRIAEFSYIQFAIFSSLGLSVLLQRIGRRLSVKTVLSVLLIIIFVTSAVVQAYPRLIYDSTYVPVYYDEYPTAFQQPYYVGIWWLNAANHTYTNRPFAGSGALEPDIRGYGLQGWWAENMSSPAVALNNSRSRIFTVYYAVDIAQLYKGEHFTNVTLSPQLVSSQNGQLDMIFSTGKIVILVKPASSS